MFNRELVSQVRELMERFGANDIAHKLHLDPYLIQAVVDFVNGVT
jgi:ADP-dependent phosphofructokinase/glucokinase